MSDEQVVTRLSEILVEIEEAAQRGLAWEEMNHEEYHKIVGLAKAARQLVMPQLAVTEPLAEHEHTWVKVDEDHQGLTQIRTYECRGCLAHTTLTGPMGIRSPFEVEENTDG